ncbi:MAG: CvpA family protein [Burkholderiales bacterium]
MTWFDFGIVIVVVVSVVVSLFHGLVREMVSLASWVGGFVLAMMLGGRVSAYLPKSFDPLLSALVGFLLVFVVVLVVAWIAQLVLSSAVRKAGLGPTDRALGVVFGFVRGLVIVLVVVVFAGLTPLPREVFWKEAILSGPFETAALALRPYLPAGLGDRIKYR